MVFANTAALDAVLNRGDYISQLCLLELGRYLEVNGYYPSGWDGSLGSIVLNQIDAFGVISKAKQKEFGCEGLTEYPLNYEAGIEDWSMSLDNYHELSEPLDSNKMGWSPLLDIYQVFLDKIDLDLMVNQVKIALKEGDRLSFGILLPAVDKGVAGAVGNHHEPFDTWLLTPEIKEDAEIHPNSQVMS